MSRVLLLNLSYEPISVIDWQKAIVLWILDKVEVLEFYDSVVRSAHASLKIPAVLRLKSYVRRPYQASMRFNRENIYLRDRNTCQYCGDVFSRRDLTLDHVVPVSQGGLRSWENLVAACRPCNQAKGNRTPSQAGMPLLREPFVPRSHLAIREKESSLWETYLLG